MIEKTLLSVLVAALLTAAMWIAEGVHHGFDLQQPGAMSTGLQLGSTCHAHVARGEHLPYWPRMTPEHPGCRNLR